MNERKVINILHWEFWKDEDDPNFYTVYEIREGDIIGSIEIQEGVPDTIEELENLLKDELEEDVYDFINEYIEYC